MTAARLSRRTGLVFVASALVLPFAGQVRADWPEVIDERWLRHAADGEGAAIDHEDWTQFLYKYVHVPIDGVARVRYGEVSEQDRAALQDYIAMLSATDPATLGRDDQMAFWINLYNALTVELILQNYPVASIRDITDGLLSFGPWGKDIVQVDGQDLSLDDIEHGILRPIWQDPRIHYAVNCASIGCPNLANAAYHGYSVDQMLTRAAILYVNHPRGADLDLEGRLVVSGIYDWYAEDFGDDEEAVIDHIRSYATEPLTTLITGIDEIESYDYDWSLNDATGMEKPSPRYLGSDTYLSEQAEGFDELTPGSATGETDSGQGEARRQGSGSVNEADFLDVQ